MRPLLPRQTPPPSPAMKSSSPSPTTVARKRLKTRSEEALNPSFADLPSSLLEDIMSRLELKENIRASTACKPWLEAGVAVRVVEQHPWLMCFPKRGNSFQFRDPLKWKPYTLELPELADSTVRDSRYGWLLMQRSRKDEMFFFNPFSRELISLPKLELRFRDIAFSGPPTSDNCVVIALNFARKYYVTISTSHPGATEWITTENIPTGNQLFTMYNKIVYLNERFYCYNAGGADLYSFHPSSRTWSYHGYKDVGLDCNQDNKAAFLAERNGELFLMVTSGNEKPVVYKLVSLQWEEMSDAELLDSLTFFVSFYNSEVRKNLPQMRNNVCFSRFGYNRKRCVTYSFDESSYNPSKEWGSWVELCPPRSIWIDAPKNVLNYF
ncbi:unnamed protein product [Microthlaspi erraticum]|uniref:KIB1-4 beta-propeller domain-containing protein n=1 Tax=Microthlaspi erraticum TaxID=1685480 RepID=A0A6D2HR57_9BRAS|nr:unnamed protein product [Microthlaspi erraticum]